MISVTRNNQMASLPCGNGSPMCAFGSSSSSVMVVPRENVEPMSKKRPVQQQQREQARQIEQRRPQNLAGVAVAALDAEGQGAEQEAEAEQHSAGQVQPPGGHTEHRGPPR